MLDQYQRYALVKTAEGSWGARDAAYEIDELKGFVVRIKLEKEGQKTSKYRLLLREAENSVQHFELFIRVDAGEKKSFKENVITRRFCTFLRGYKELDKEWNIYHRHHFGPQQLIVGPFLEKSFTRDSFQRMLDKLSNYPLNLTAVDVVDRAIRKFEDMLIVKLFFFEASLRCLRCFETESSCICKKGKSRIKLYMEASFLIQNKKQCAILKMRQKNLRTLLNITSKEIEELSIFISQDYSLRITEAYHCDTQNEFVNEFAQKVMLFSATATVYGRFMSPSSSLNSNTVRQANGIMHRVSLGHTKNISLDYVPIIDTLKII